MYPDRLGAGKAWMIIVLLIVTSGCAPVKEEPVQDTQSSPGAAMAPDRLSLPGTFVGSIPCDDCLRVDIVLNLRPDMLYQLRKSYMSSRGVQKVESQMRNWRYSTDGRMIILGKQKGMLKTYVVMDDNTLVFLEAEGEREQGKEPIKYTLTRSLAYEPFGDEVKMRGMFSITERGATLRECSSGRLFNVARSGAFEQTAKEYLRTPHQQGEPLLLSFAGTVWGMGEVGGQAEYITIKEFRRFYSGADCLGDSANTALTGTVWALHSVNNRETTSFSYQSAPYLIMRKDFSLEGYGGCNGIAGTYLVRGDVLLFNRTIQTRLACFEGNELESLFLDALDNAELFRIESGTLVLLGENGKVLATFTDG